MGAARASKGHRRRHSAKSAAHKHAQVAQAATFQTREMTTEINAQAGYIPIVHVRFDPTSPPPPS
jgi:hypothetical protein